MKRALFIIFILLLALLLMGASFIFGTFKAKKTVELPPAGWSENSEAALAWRELTVSQEAAAARIIAAAADEQERVEGLDFLSDLLSLSVEMKFQKGSETSPQFTDWMGDHRKVFGDTPDAIYHTAQISANYRYEITGNIGEAEYLGIILYGRQPNGWNRAGSNLSLRDIKPDIDGNFRIVLSREAPVDGAAWLRLEGDIHMVMMRQYFHDRPSKNPANFNIRNVDTATPNRPSDGETAAGLRAARVMFNEVVDGTFALADMVASAPNRPDPPKTYNADFSGIFYPTHDNQYFGSWYKIERGEALMIEGPAPDADYWSVSLQNRWMQSLDYANKQISLDNHQIKTHNGRYRIIVAHNDPGTENWLETDGHSQGILAIRYQLSGEVERPNITLVKLSEIKGGK